MVTFKIFLSLALIPHEKDVVIVSHTDKDITVIDAIEEYRRSYYKDMNFSYTDCIRLSYIIQRLLERYDIHYNDIIISEGNTMDIKSIRFYLRVISIAAQLDTTCYNVEITLRNNQGLSDEDIMNLITLK